MQRKIRILIVRFAATLSCLLVCDDQVCKACQANLLISSQTVQEIEEQKPKTKVTRQSKKEGSIKIKSTTEEILKEEEIEEIRYSEEEISLLKKTTFAEGGICSQDVQQAIAATIIARAKENNQSIKEVIFDDGQFSSVINQVPCINTRENPIPVTDEMAEEVSKAVELAITEGAGKVSKKLEESAIQQGLDSKVYGGEPLYFYSPKGCSEEELEKRSSIQVTYSEDGVTFYRIWG